MGGHQPLHPAREVTVAMRAEDQVEVVGHEAVGEQSHGQPDRGFADGLEEGGEVLGLVEDLGSGVTPVEDVVAIPGL